MSADLLLARLRRDDALLTELADLVLDDLLDRPVSELVEPAWMAERLTDALRASVEDPRTKDWIRARVKEARRQLDGVQGPLSRKVDPKLVKPMKELLRRPYSPDPLVVRALIDHRAMRSLVRDILQSTLQDFIQKAKMPAQGVLRGGGLGASRLAQWAGAAKAAASLIGDEVEHLLQDRVHDFLDLAITKALDTMAAHITDPRHARDNADWRADSVDVLLAFPAETWRKELDKLDPEGMVDQVHGVVKAVVEWPGFTGAVEEVLRAVAEDGRSARDFLAGSGLEDRFRPQLRELAVKRGRAIVEGPAFEAWLRKALDG